MYDINDLSDAARAAVRRNRPFKVTFVNRETDDEHIEWFRSPEDAYIVVAGTDWEVESKLYYGYYN